MPERVAVYPGSFDPPTYGHLDLIERATKMWDRLVVAVATNNEKSCLFSVDERVVMLREITSHIEHVTCTSFTGLTAEFAREQGANALLRGLRVVSDFEFELTMAVTNRVLDPDIDTVCLMPGENYQLLSSRLVKEIAEYSGDVSPFVPPLVANELKRKLGVA
jgi:pantetheine-phosphate adenylyltransferase